MVRRSVTVVYEEGQVPSLEAGKTHVFLELGDHLGSTSVVLDKATSEIVERSTYEAYGAAESDYRPGRWAAFREDYRFTGKEDDIEAGLIYFGARFYAPLVGRWLSADPLAVHGSGGDLNVYAYVHGRVLHVTDPVGLEDAPQRPDPTYVVNPVISDAQAERDQPKNGAVAMPTMPVNGSPPDRATSAAAPVIVNKADEARVDPNRVIDTGAQNKMAPPNEQMANAFDAYRNAGVENAANMTKAWVINVPFVKPFVDMAIDQAFSALRAPEPPASPTNFHDWDLRQKYDTAHDGATFLATTVPLGAGAIGGPGFGGIAGETAEGETLSRLGTSSESAARLGRKAAEAEGQIGIHGVSTTAGAPRGPASQAVRTAVEEHFPVHDTPTRNDPLHRTVELPKPVTKQVADLFNKLFGR